MRYVNGVTELTRFIVRGLFPEKGELAFDMTLGNGHDTMFLSENFKKVIAMDIQKEAVDQFQAPENVVKMVKDHSRTEDLEGEPDLVIYNLGYLPGHSKTITTRAETTIKSLEIMLKKVKPGGFIIIAVYYGHDGGEEGEKVLRFVRGLDKNYGVMHHEFINRGNNPPSLLVIERRS